MSKKSVKVGGGSTTTDHNQHSTASKGGLQEDKNQHLMDEVSGLIEQEKTLLGLKLLEQQKQAQLWKKKYEDLIGKVVKEADGLQSDFPAMELIANSMFTYNNRMKSDAKLSAEEIFQNLFEYSNVDFSKYFVDNGTLQEIVRCLTTRLQNKTVSSLTISNSSLEDKHAEAIGHLIAHSKILALDLSMNRLGLDFLKALVASVRLRRLSPQYLLLQGNEPLASLMTTTSFYSDARVPISIGLVNQFIESSVNDSMWGICISLRDYDVTYLRKDSGELDSKSVGGRAGGRAASPSKVSKVSSSKALKGTLYADDNTHPMQILSFLTSLCNSINTNNRLARGKASPTKASKRQAEDKAKRAKEAHSVPVAASPAAVETAAKGISKLSVLGLMYSQISKPSLTKLEELLQLNLNTLTDLDLSFSYLGSAGVDVISTFLKESEHSLVRLGLAGNCLHDKGFSSIMRAVTHSETIAFIDMRSNDITNDGLPALPQCLIHNCIISNVNLAGNAEISLSNTIYYSNLIRSNGSCAKITWDPKPTETIVAIGNSNSKLNNVPLQEPPTSCFFLYRNPAKQFRPISMVSRDALLYSIDLRRLNSGRVDDWDDRGGGVNPNPNPNPTSSSSATGGVGGGSRHCRLNWSWRPSDTNAHIMRAGSSSISSAPSTGFGVGGSSSYGFIDLMSAVLSYEVRVLNSKGSAVDSLQRTGSVPMSDCLAPLAASSLHSSRREFNWLLSHVDLFDLPDSGTIEVYINITNNRQFAPRNINKSSKSSTVRISAFECMNCEVQSISESESHLSLSAREEQSGISALVAEQSSSGFEWPEMGTSEMLVSFYQNSKHPSFYSALLSSLYESISREHKVMRLFNWISSSSKGVVCLDIRLNSTGKDRDSSDNSDGSTGGFIYGYETCITVISNGRVIGYKLSENVPNNSISHSDTRSNSIHVTDVFSVWNWKRQFVEFDNASPNDTVVVSVAMKLRDSTGNVIYANIPASKCSIVVKSLSLFSIDSNGTNAAAADLSEVGNGVDVDENGSVIDDGSGPSPRIDRFSSSSNSGSGKIESIKIGDVAVFNGAYNKVYPAGGSAILNPENLNFMM